MRKLYIGNKNYSSWSMRPWVLMTQLGIPFEEVMVRFDSFGPDSVFKATMGAITPVGNVPALVDGDITVWDTLAIVETLAESFPDKGVWPADPRQRAHARSLCAEMHSGFGALRSACPMNIEASLPTVGAVVLRDQPGVRADLARITRMWQELLTQHGGPMLFGAFSAADAFYAPVVMRLRTYGMPVPDDVRAYMDRVCATPAVKAWIDGALAEHDFVDFDEPYRVAP